MSSSKQPTYRRSQLICVGDTVFCKHQQALSAPFPTPPPSSPEWIPGDDLVGSTEPARSLKSQRSAVDLSIGKIGSRISRRLPSISSRWRDKVPTTSISSPAARSAPPSRSASAKHSAKNSLASFLGPHETMLLFAPQAKPLPDVSRRPSSPTLPEPSGFLSGNDFEDPIDRKELASTPLLPPVLTELRAEQHESFQSPLQSPSVATPSTAATFVDTPLSSPIFQSAQSPPLSSKPSFASMARVQSNHVPYETSDAGPGAEMDELEYYNMKLGHANFHIFPEPYMPERGNEESCDQLLADWETARHEYMRQAYAISQNYGPTSNTYKLTSAKWALIDRQWQDNIERSRAEAEAHGEKPRQDILPETAPVAKIPSLPFDPEHPDKFPSLNEGGIVGPMLQYAKVQRPSSKKRNFLKLLLEPFSSNR